MYEGGLERSWTCLVRTDPFIIMYVWRVPSTVSSAVTFTSVREERLESFIVCTQRLHVGCGACLVLCRLRDRIDTRMMRPVLRVLYYLLLLLLLPSQNMNKYSIIVDSAIELQSPRALQQQ